MATAWDEKAVFLAALDLPTEQRPAYLERACPTPEARRRIEELLSHHAIVTRELLEATRARDIDPSQPPPAIERIEEFQIVRPIGAGGMGVVYLAEDLLLGRRVAVKILAPHMASSEAALARFRTEAKAMAAVSHPAIVPVYRFGQDGELHYIVSEYVDGPTLASRIEEERGRRTAHTPTESRRAWVRDAAEIIAAIADALDAAHRARLIHRDVKPSNILLDRDRGARLTDFGIAKEVVEDVGPARTGVIGTCHYMSPEQAAISDTTIDQRSDIFSLGVVMYELLALRRPFDGGNAAAILRAVMEQEPLRLRRIDALIPRDLETICHKALEKQPDRRYQTAAHFAADLRCYLEGKPILAAPPTVSRRLGRWIVRRRTPLAAASVVVLICLVALTAWQLQRARDASYAWVAITSDTDGCVAWLQAADPATFELQPVAQRLGALPIAAQRLTPGQYRITVVTPTGDDWAEFDVLATTPGRQHGLRLIVHSFGAAVRGVKPEERHAWLRGDAAATPPMARIEHGEYIIGWSADAGPLVKKRSVSVPSFYLDRTEVSNREYRAFMAATGAPPPEYWRQDSDGGPPDDLPVIGIALEDAEAYARWVGKRLPTAFEWQAAARGPEGRDFPWGNDPAAAPPLKRLSEADADAAAAWDLKARYEVYRRNAAPVTTPDPLATANAILHLYGNVGEWTSTYDVALGDAYVLGRTYADPPTRPALGNASTFPANRISEKYGFRCARSAAPPK